MEIKAVFQRGPWLWDINISVTEWYWMSAVFFLYYFGKFYLGVCLLYRRYDISFCHQVFTAVGASYVGHFCAVVSLGKL